MEDFLITTKSRHPQWQTYAESAWDAIVTLEMSKEAIAADWRSSLFRTKVFTAIPLDRLRAHESGGFELKKGVWIPCENGMSVSVIEKLEAAMKTAMVLLVQGIGRFDEFLKNGVLSNGLRDVALSPMTQEVFQSSLNRAEVIVNSSEVGRGRA